MNLVNHWIGGKPVEDVPELVGEIYNPATGDVTGHVAFAPPDVVDRAVAVARRAFESWRHSSLAQRTRILFAFRDLLERHEAEIAQLITNEHGKVIDDALGDVRRGIQVVEFACGIPDLIKGEFSENVSTNVDAYSIRQPVGVAAGITPFNFPALVPMMMFPIAIACGNAFVHKPSEKDPSVANLLAELLAEAGLPEGVFNVVHGDQVAVERLLEHPAVAAISFVGSTRVARQIYAKAASHGKRVQALGGAKNHMVVMPDAEMAFTADSAVSATYGNTGQRCMAVSAAVAVGGAGDEFVASLQDRIASLKVGPGSDPTAQLGPLVTAEARDRVVSYIESGLQEGAELVIDGRGVSIPGHEAGFFLGPTVFDHVTAEMSIYRDEIFGPVLVVARADTVDEAITLVNHHPYGNGGAIFTTSGAAARKFVREVEVGMVGVNVAVPVPVAFYGLGGWKSSLFGDGQLQGRAGVHFYTRPKVATVRWPD